MPHLPDISPATMGPELRESTVVQDVLQGRAIDGLYLHVPFCVHRCRYCDFFSIVDPGRHGAFVDAIALELRSRSNRTCLAPRTIYVGGGTPPALAGGVWRNLLAELDRGRIRSNVREFTVEANPETLSPELAQVLSAGGVSRMSIGAQSSDPTLLATLDRQHSPVSVAKAVDVTRRAGIDNISLDYIFAIPGQTMAMLDADIDTAIGLAPQHVSFYGLTYEPKTALARQVRAGDIAPTPIELERRMYERLIERLDAAGYEHYEISNWALRTRAGHDQTADSGSPYRCEHNLIYWRNGNWLGLGPSAASHVDGFRWKNLPDLGRYLASPADPPTVDHERLDESARLGEQLMLGLRTRQGVPLDWLTEQLARDERRRRTIDELIDLKMLQTTATHLRLTDQGLFVADTVIAKLL